MVFTWRDQAHGDRRRTMRLHAHEFLRRFLLYVLPGGFVRVRSYELLANRDRQERIARCREALGAPPGDPPPPVVETGWAELFTRLTGTDPNRCLRCGQSVSTSWPRSPQPAADPRRALCPLP